MDFARLLRSGALGAAGAAPAAPKPLVSFKCGRVNSERVGGTKLRLTADPRKGELSLLKDGQVRRLVLPHLPADQTTQPGFSLPPLKHAFFLLLLLSQGVMHIMWKDRSTGDQGMDLEVFPGDVEFKRIAAPVPGDRIYELRFTATARREFFWAQEAKEAADKDGVAKLVEFVNNPSAAAAASAPAAGPRAAAAGGLTAEMVQQMLASLEVGGRSAAPATRASASTGAGSVAASTAAAASTPAAQAAAPAAPAPAPPAAAPAAMSDECVPQDMPDSCVSPLSIL